jgi:phage antirepressor YoqD-like protein
MAMSYSYEMQAKVFDRMTALEAQAQNPITSMSRIDLLKMALASEEKLAEQAALIESQRPAVEFVDKFVSAKAAKGFREVAKVLGIKEREFIAKLAQDGVIFKQGTNWLPTAQHQHSGRFEVKTGEANGHAFIQTRFTPEGIAWVARRFVKESA